MILQPYSEGALAAYCVTDATKPEHRASDAIDFRNDVFWVVWVYFQDKKLIWC